MKFRLIKIITILLLCILLVFSLSHRKISLPRIKPAESFNNNYIIPKLLFQTYISYDKVPSRVKKNIKKYAFDYKYNFYSDDDCYNFIKDNFPYEIINAYQNLYYVKAHRADLIRYCLLYKFGGVYLDIKTELIMPLNNIFNKNYTYTCLCTDQLKDCIYQGIIATRKENPLFLKLINYISKTNQYPNPKKYNIYTRDFYYKIKDLIIPNETIKEGLNITKNNNDDNIYLFKEKCTRDKNDCYDGLDRHKYCCYIYDKGRKIFKTRYSDYPW